MKKSKIITAIILAVIAIAVAVLALTGSIEAIEPEIHKLLKSDPQLKDGLYDFLYSFTVLGDVISSVFIVAVLLFLPATTKKVGIPVAATAIVSTVLNKVIKTIVARPRPLEELRLLEIDGYSFPSGHAMNNSAIYIAIMMCLLPLCKTKLQRGITVAIFTIIPFIIGISRIYFNVHYTSDVVCGWCLGAIIALLMSEIPFQKAINKKVN